MNFLVIGLGSMGKRRIRCLSALGHEYVWGFDIRQDRRDEVTQLYGVQAFGDIEEAITASNPDALIISVPPDVHHQYMQLAADRGIHFFVEASVIDDGLGDLAEQVAAAGIVGAPSATMRFHPAIRTIYGMVRSGKLGKLSNVLYHSGQYLPDWHTYESVKDFYVSNPLTGGAREILPFELSWFIDLFGMPRKVFGSVRKTIDIPGADRIDDTYNCLLDYGDFLATVIADVVSRVSTRRLVVNGTDGQLVWDWNEHNVAVYSALTKQWDIFAYDTGVAHQGYNVNIGEGMYVDELHSFIEAALGNGEFVNTLRDDRAVLSLLYCIEEADRTGQAQEIASA